MLSGRIQPRRLCSDFSSQTILITLSVIGYVQLTAAVDYWPSMQHQTFESMKRNRTYLNNALKTDPSTSLSLLRSFISAGHIVPKCKTQVHFLFLSLIIWWDDSSDTTRERLADCLTCSPRHRGKHLHFKQRTLVLQKLSPSCMFYYNY